MCLLLLFTAPLVMLYSFIQYVRATRTPKHTHNSQSASLKWWTFQKSRRIFCVSNLHLSRTRTDFLRSVTFWDWVPAVLLGMDSISWMHFICVELVQGSQQLILCPATFMNEYLNNDWLLLYQPKSCNTKSELLYLHRTHTVNDVKVNNYTFRN